ncbi:MAG TPA: GNAT family N-acetyltransferase, partial [Thermomicrobiales bacterium]|nr:GNAT family N-acetyltransferase [Thermomicrobiales bacterium]
DAPRLADDVRQTYLVGESLYIRALERGDARHALAWRPKPFPISAKRAEQDLDQTPSLDAIDAEPVGSVLVACRRADGEPVGAALIDLSFPITAEVHLHVERRPGRDAGAIGGEMLTLVAPWLSAEIAYPSVWTELDGGEPALVAAAERIGMRPGSRLRDAIWRDGRRFDQLGYELLHPGWLERMGDPGVGIESEGGPVTAPRSPAPRTWPVGDGPIPPNALAVSPRLALRPFEIDDAPVIARASREEPEMSFNARGRQPMSPLSVEAWIAKQGEQTPPPAINLAVALRQTGELIGETNLVEIDWIAQTAETAAWIYQPRHRGGGLGTEMKHLLLEYAFDRLGFHQVRSYVYDINPRSAAAVRKQGYRDAGRQWWVSVKGASFVGWDVFDLLAEEWRAARSD